MINYRSMVRSGAVCALVVFVCSWATEARADGPVVVFADDFENGNTNGWLAVRDPNLTATAGDWVIGDPNGTEYNGADAQPEDAYSGSGCAFTAQNTSVGAHDVDDGAVWFISPPIDLAGATTAELSYVRWYYNARPEHEDPWDYFAVDVRAGENDPWVRVEFLGYADTANTWTPRSIALEGHIALGAAVQIRFVASDGRPRGSILEAAVDDVAVLAGYACAGDDDCGPGTYCGPAAACVSHGNGDFDGDGDVDLADAARFQSCFGTAASGACAAGNLSGDMYIDPTDLLAFHAVLTGPSAGG